MSFANRLADLVVAHPRRCMAVATGLLLLFALLIPGIVIDNSVDTYIPANHPITIENTRYDRLFGPGTALLVAFEHPDLFDPDFLNELGTLTRRLDGLDAVIREDLRDKNRAELLRLLSLTAEDAAEVLPFLQGLPTDSLDTRITVDEIEMYGVSRAAAERLAARYASLPPDGIKRLAALLAPAFVKEATSIVNADYVEGAGGRFTVERLVTNEKIGPADVAMLKERLSRWDIYEDFLIDRGRTAAVILVRMHEAKTSHYELVLRYVKKAIADSPLAETPHYLAGEPVVTAIIGSSMTADLRWLIPLVILIVVGTLYVSFRQIGPVLIPLVGVLYATVMTIGLMSLLNVPITVVTTVLPVLLIAVGSAYGIHVVNRYLMHPHPDPKEAVRESLRSVFTPVAMAAFTTVGGFAALISNEVVPIRNFGFFTACGVASSFLAAVIVVPSLLLLFRVKRRHLESGAPERPNRFLAFLSRFAIRRHWAILASGVLLVVGAAIAALSIRVDTDMVGMFREDTPIRIATDFLNTRFKGTATVEIVIDSKTQDGALTPEVLTAVDGFLDWLRNDPTVPEEIRTNVGGVVSVVDYVKKANKAMHGEDPAFYRIPDSRQAILDYMLILKGSTTDLCTRDGSALKLILTMKSGSTEIGRGLEPLIREYFSARGVAYPRFLGYVAKTVTVDRLIVSGQIWSIIFSLITVFLLNAAVFRSLIGAAISLVPIVISIMINFGFMGISGIMLDIGTAMTASIAIGIGIDYTIHFIEGYTRRSAETDDVEKNLRDTGLSTGRAILFNMCSVMLGFAVILLSSFNPLINFGLLIALIMATTGLASLTVIPAIISGTSRLAFFKKMSERERARFAQWDALKEGTKKRLATGRRRS